jgi:hypothetical protein
MTWDDEQYSPASRGTSSKIGKLATTRTPMTAGTPTIAGTSSIAGTPPTERRDVNNAGTPAIAGTAETLEIRSRGTVRQYSWDGSNIREVTTAGNAGTSSKYIGKSRVGNSTRGKLEHEGQPGNVMGRWSVNNNKDVSTEEMPATADTTVTVTAGTQGTSTATITSGQH